MVNIMGMRIIKRDKGSSRIIKLLEFEGEFSEKFDYECGCGWSGKIKDFKGTVFKCPGCKYEGEVPAIHTQPVKKVKVKKDKLYKSEK